MAKFECTLRGDFRGVLLAIDQGILSGSVSASQEAASRYEINGVKCAVSVYERYSWFGGNRVSLTVTLIGHGDTLFLSGITAGGSQALFFKINTFGEEAFLNKLRDVVDRYQR